MQILCLLQQLGVQAWCMQATMHSMCAMQSAIVWGYLKNLIVLPQLTSAEIVKMELLYNVNVYLLKQHSKSWLAASVNLSMPSIFVRCFQFP